MEFILVVECLLRLSSMEFSLGPAGTDAAPPVNPVNVASVKSTISANAFPLNGIIWMDLGIIFFSAIAPFAPAQHSPNQ